MINSGKANHRDERPCQMFECHQRVPLPEEQGYERECRLPAANVNRSFR